MKDGADRLQSINIYTNAELKQLAEALERLNVSKALYAHWPDTRDPEVVELLAKDDFYPIEMDEQEVIDPASYIVYVKDAGGQDTEEIDYAQSVIKKTTALAPVRPSDHLERTKRAQEAVARRRAGSLT
jgi:hypothetical protein